MMIPKPLICKDCGWVGYTSELVRNSFTMGDPQACCPACGGDRIENHEPNALP
jgi:predicted Zn-ribbon and HTH transcriptional regulator